MSDNKLITPRKVNGFWELMPSEQQVFSELLSKIEEVFKLHCFVPLDTPVLEFSDALLAKSGGETDKQVFRFTKGDADMCMRYDLTVPLARFVAMHKNELTFPFKRYQIGKVYRGERPQKGRFREFYQCDADIIGDGELSLVADAECVKLFEECFKALGLDIEIHLSNRKILSGLFEELDVQNFSHEILTILDKADKIGQEEEKRELLEIVKSEQKVEKLTKIAKKSGKISEILPFFRDFCKNDLFQSGLNELESVCNFLSAMDCEVVCDMSIIRGHDYYTGTVFEGFLSGQSGAFGGGGRYENLCGYFSNDKMPGVGMSVGITRLFDVLKANFAEKFAKNDQILVLNFEETLPDALKIVSTLHEAGISADILCEQKTFKAKMKAANRLGAKYVLIVGEEEVKEQKFTLKNMETGQQSPLTLEEIVKMALEKGFEENE